MANYFKYYYDNFNTCENRVYMISFFFYVMKDKLFCGQTVIIMLRCGLFLIEILIKFYVLGIVSDKYAQPYNSSTQSTSSK